MPLTGEATTIELLRAYHEHGDRSAREQLIELHLPLVRSLAKRYAGRTEPLDDLVQVGAIGLINAVDRFRLDRGGSLASFAIPTILGELRRYFRDRSWSLHVPRRTRELFVALVRVIEPLSSELGRSPEVGELADAVGATEEEVVEALDAGRVSATLPLPSSLDEDDLELGSCAALGAEDGRYEVTEDRTVLRPWVGTVSERERRIIHMRFFAGMTQSQIAAEVGISQMHVSRLIRRALETMRETALVDA